MDRIFLGENDTAESLVLRCGKLTDIQALRAMEIYIGKWIHIAGYIVNLSPFLQGVSVSVMQSSGALWTTWLYFKRDIERLEIANVGEMLIAQGEIQSISRQGLGLINCELRDIRVPEQPIALFAEPEAIPLVLGDAASNAIDARSLPRLPEAALKAWHAAFLIAYPNGSKALAEKSASGAFPDHHVARERVRELFPDTPRGRPKKSDG
jgi:hypothetical protein